MLSLYLLVLLREEAFRSVPDQGPLGPVSEVICFFRNMDLLSISGGQPSAVVIDVGLESLLKNTDQ